VQHISIFAEIWYDVKSFLRQLRGYRLIGINCRVGADQGAFRNSRSRHHTDWKTSEACRRQTSPASQLA
jgi:hypothetical protein